MKFAKSKKIANAKKMKRNSDNSHSKNALPCLAVKEFNNKEVGTRTADSKPDAVKNLIIHFSTLARY